jgi:hypothetical protein
MDRNQNLEVPVGLLLDMAQGIITLSNRRARYFKKPPVGLKKSELMEIKDFEDKLCRQAESVNKRILQLIEGQSND